MYFDLSAPAGARGAEGMRILQMEPPRRLAFTWNAPPHLPSIRGQRTVVVVTLDVLSATRTKVTLTHSAWGRGGEWDKAYQYFSHAWTRVVLPRLVQRFASGPIDWTQTPGRSAS
jgi:uncharacterized protein YndB with AHSA1/START domain